MAVKADTRETLIGVVGALASHNIDGATELLRGAGLRLDAPAVVPCLIAATFIRMYAELSGIPAEELARHAVLTSRLWLEDLREQGKVD